MLIYFSKLIQNMFKDFSLSSLVYFLLPEKLSHYFAYLGKFRHFKVSYSQFGEDLILERYLEYKKILKGKYLDIGACHPRWLSNTHLLHNKGFSGYCVDLDEKKLKWFRFARGNKVKTICGAVSNSKKKYIDMYTVRTNSPFSLLDTISKKHSKLKGRKNIQFKTRKVRNFHINDIFAKVGKINVLNIDIESKDFEYLKSSNLKIVNPEVILIEDLNGYFPSNQFKNFFWKRGYFLISICGKTKIFAKK